MNLENKKTLIAFLSHKGENYYNGKIIFPFCTHEGS